MKVKAYIIRKNFESKSLLLLFESFGLQIWLRPDQIINYPDLNPNTHSHLQEIEINEMIATW